MKSSKSVSLKAPLKPAIIYKYGEFTKRIRRVGINKSIRRKQRIVCFFIIYHIKL